MRHRSQETTSVFVKKNLHDNSPTTIDNLRQQIYDLPDNKLVEHLMRFGSSIRGTMAYWTKFRAELTDMFTQLGCPYFFFTLTAPDTNWPELHSLMHVPSHSRSLNEHHMKIENVIQYPHIVATFMHHRFNIFREEVIQKYLKAKDIWYRYVLLNLFSIHCQFLIMVLFIFFVVTLYSFSSDMSGNIDVHHISMVSYGCK